jgi:hypothetical protein
MGLMSAAKSIFFDSAAEDEGAAGWPAPATFKAEAAPSPARLQT